MRIMDKIRKSYKDYRTERRARARISSEYSLKEREARLEAFKMEREKRLAMIRRGEKPVSRVGEGFKRFGKDVLTDLDKIGGGVQSASKKSKSGMFDTSFDFNTDILGYGKRRRR